jgi:hypothetical protein
MQQEAMILKCCRCHRILLGHEWVQDTNDRLSRQLMAAQPTREFMHSCCQDCLRHVHADLEVRDFAMVEERMPLSRSVA